MLIQLRRDTGANWSSKDPTLAAGEIGVDLTANKHKVGDGTTAWSGLTFVEDQGGGGGGGGVTTLAALTDVAVSGVSDGDILGYDNNTSKWIPVSVLDGGGA